MDKIGLLNGTRPNVFLGGFLGKLELFLSAAGFANFIVYRIVAQVLTAGIFPGDGVQ